MLRVATNLHFFFFLEKVSLPEFDRLGISTKISAKRIERKLVLRRCMHPRKHEIRKLRFSAKWIEVASEFAVATIMRAKCYIKLASTDECARNVYVHGAVNFSTRRN